MTAFDYIIVGAGSAGCVLAYRLSENPRHSVLLIEAGPPDDDPAIHRPKGYLETHGDPRLTWRYPTTLGEGEWRGSLIAGKTLGGTSAINSMLYVRGQPRDYDDWAAGGAPGWAWKDIEPCYHAMEDYAVGPEGGRGGPLSVNPWTPHDRLSDAIIGAGVDMGLVARADLNAGPAEGSIGYFPVTLKDRRRVSSADAFLKPARGRPNLRVVTGMAADRILFDGRRASGVLCRSVGGPRSFHAGGEVIVACGTLQSPALLQRSGLGPAAHLKAAGIEMVCDSPGVGANLIERWSIRVQHRLLKRMGQNHQLRGLGRRVSRLRYALTGGGIMGTATTEVGAFVRASEGADRPDIELQIGGGSTVIGAARQFEREPGLRCIVSLLRPFSRGSVMIKSADPDAPPSIALNVFADARDRQVMADGVRFVRRLLRQPSLAPYLGQETTPGEACLSEAEIIDAALRLGSPKSHFGGTCKMGEDATAVLDPRLRVRGVGGLRVVDGSIMPSLVSGNTNGPIMAMAWRASDLILEDAAAGRAP